MKTSVAFEIDAPPDERDRLVAELHSWGTLGLLEREQGFVAYFPDASALGQIRSLEDAQRRVHVRGPLPVPDQDWEERWRDGLEPRCVAGLWIRPSWCASQGTPEILIDPKQAFGTGEHATTRLALALLLEALRPGDSLLDVGSGSGILALAALRRGAGSALGIDTDADACRNARENAERNGLPLRLCRGTTAALRPGLRCDVLVANMLASELASCLGDLVQLAGRELILSGYLESESQLWDAPLASAGWQRKSVLREAQSGDVWLASRWLHARARQSSSTQAKVDRKE